MLHDTGPRVFEAFDQPLALCAQTGGDQLGARRVLARPRRILGNFVTLVGQPALAALRAVVATGQPRAAWRGAAAAEVEQHLCESLRVFTLGGLLLDAAQTELWWARLLKERGCPWEEAQPHLHKATQIFAAAGCEYAVAHAEDGSRR